MSRFYVEVDLINYDDVGDVICVGPFRTIERAEEVAASLNRTAEAKKYQTERGNVRAGIRAFRSVAEARTEVREHLTALREEEDG